MAAMHASRKELDERAQAGEEVVPGGKGGKSLHAQERLAEGRSKGGHSRSGQEGSEGKQETKGGQNGSAQSETEEYEEMDRKDLEERALSGEEVVPGGKGGKSLDAQERLAEGRSKGGQTRSAQLGTEGYQEMGRKGGLATLEQTGEEAANTKGIAIDESKFKTTST